MDIMGEVTNLVVVSNPIGITECQRCGNCCKNIILHGNFSEKTKEWLRERGCGFMPDGAVVIPFKCPHLIEDDHVIDSTFKIDLYPLVRCRCDIYETRPEVCREYRCWK